MSKPVLTFKRSCEIHLDSGFKILGVDTTETDRAIDKLQEFNLEYNESLYKKISDDGPMSWLRESGFSFYTWDSISGIVKRSVDDTGRVTIGVPITGTEDIRMALTHITNLVDPSSNPLDKAGFFVMQNLQFAVDADPTLMGDLVQLLREVLKVRNRHLFLVGNNTIFPKEASQHFVVLDFKLPNREELIEHITDYVSAKLGRTYPEEVIISAADAAVGLTLAEVEAALAVAAVVSKGKTLDTEIIFDEKSKIVRKSGLLEHIPTDIDMHTQVGGLDNLRSYLATVAEVFTNRNEALKYGVRMPRGLLITGVPGTGKSHTAKATANLFKVPLYRLDIGSLFGSLVGQTEANTRELFKLLEALAPCVAYLDEVEKGLAGVGQAHTDETTTRFFGALLTWLQEKTAPVYVVATANNHQTLPPEFVRRMDEIFFVDVPSATDRLSVLEIQLRMVNREPKDFKGLATIAKNAKGRTGAEIKDAIDQAMLIAFKDNRREFTSADIKLVLASTEPLVELKKEEIAALREWASKATRKANVVDESDVIHKRTTKTFDNTQVPTWLEKEQK